MPDIKYEEDSTLDLERYKKFYIFEGASDYLIKMIVGASPIENIKSGTVLITEGDESDGKAYLILEGKVSVIKGEDEVATLTVGDIFGEYALICDEPRTATVIASSDLVCNILNKENLLELSQINNIINKTIISRLN